MRTYLTAFQTYRVHHTFTLYPLEACLNYSKIGGVDHDWHFADLRLCSNDAQELLHSSVSIKHTLIKIDISILSKMIKLVCINYNIWISMICAPASTCCLATSKASSYLFCLMRLANRREPETLHRSPTFTKFVVGPITSCSRPILFVNI